MKMEQAECSETLAFKLQTPGNYPKEIIQHTENGESLKSRLHIYLTGSDPILFRPQKVNEFSLTRKCIAVKL
jgi:hypothetical protein